MQAITTTYLSPTNTRGARIRAQCASGSVLIAPPVEAQTTDEEHAAAVRALLKKLGWEDLKEWIGGDDYRGSRVWVYRHAVSAVVLL